MGRLPRKFAGGSACRASIDNRANSALQDIGNIIGNADIPAAVRLVLAAERMAQEPILTGSSPTARQVRKLASRYKCHSGLGQDSRGERDGGDMVPGKP